MLSPSLATLAISIRRRLPVVKFSVTVTIMASRAVDKGPTAARVAENVRELRETNHLSLTELAERMDAVGRPMMASGLHKIEKGERRVDVDDLVALALTLDVAPNRLLLPAEADRTAVALTATVRAGAEQAWRWACGEAALPLPFEPDTETRLAAQIGYRNYSFPFRNAPHVPRDELTIEETEEHAEVLEPVFQAARTALDAGMTEPTLVNQVRMAAMTRRYAEWRKRRTHGEH